MKSNDPVHEGQVLTGSLFSLLVRMRDHEDGFTERKLDGTKARDYRRSLVAFANSASEDRPRILREKGQLITFRQIDLDQWNRECERYTVECRVEGCDAPVVNLFDVGSGRPFSVPLEQIRINRDNVRQRTMLEAIA